MTRPLRALESEFETVQTLREQVRFLEAEQHRLKEELRNSEKLFHTTFDLTSIGKALVSTEDGRFIRANPKFSEMTGYTQKELQSMTYADITYRDDLEVSIRMYQGLMQGEISSYVLDKRYVRKNGTYFWATISGASIRNEWNQVVTIVTAIQDISERKASEEQEHQSLLKHQNLVSLLHATLESTTDGILVVDLEGNITRFNQNFLNLWNIPRETLDSSQDAQAISFVLNQLKDPNRFTSKVQELYTNLEANSHDILEFKDGRVYERSSRPQRLGDKVVGRVWSFHDITERIKNLNQLKELSLRLSRVMTSISDYLWSATIDKENHITYQYFSPVVERITGRPPEFFMAGSDRWMSTVHPDDRTRLMDIYQQVLAKSSECKEIDYRIVLPDGKVRWVRDSTTLGPTDADGNRRIDGVVSDITERKLYLESQEHLLAQEVDARKEAERVVQLRDDFLSIAAHELRTPLTPIRMNVRLLSQFLENLHPETPKLDIVRKVILRTDYEFERFLKLVENLLDVSRIRAGRLVLERHEFDLTELVKTIVERFEPELEKAACEIHLNATGPIVGQWDSGRIEQVIINLLSNAMKYGKHHPIEINLSKTADRAVFVIQDHGIGMSDEDQKRLFRRFERIAPLKHFGGFGLGLFITHEIIEAHGGIISLQSQPGSGTIFIVELPLLKPR